MAFLGCGSRVDMQPQGAGGAATQASSTAAATAGNGGAGGADLSMGGAGAGPACSDDVSYFVEVAGDGPLQSFDEGCEQYLEPSLTLMQGCRVALAVAACEGYAKLELNALLDKDAIQFTGVRYQTASAVYETDMGAFRFGIPEVGQPSRGSYEATVVNTQDPNSTLDITGSFVVCRQLDMHCEH